MKKSWLIVCSAVIAAMVMGACQPAAPAAPAAATSAPAAAAPAAATQPAAAAKKPFRVGLIVATGGLGDRSFNDSAYAGVQQAQKELGIEFDYVEPKEIAEFESHERAYAQKEKYDLIVGIGFDQADPMKKVAAEFPNQKWLEIDGSIEGLANVRSVTFKDWEKTFLIGGAAAQLATLPLPKASQKKCVLGGVGGMDIPLIRAFAAGYSAGARYVNRDCKIILNYVGGWADPAKGKEIALSMYDQGTDIVYAYAGGSGLGVFEAAKARDKYAIGTDVNQNYIDPDHIVLSAERHVGAVIYNTIKDAIGGKFEAGHVELGLKDGAVGYTFDQSKVEVPQSVKDKMEEMKAKVISGELVIPNTLEAVDTFVTGLK